jgi:hypothetical protein
MCAFLIKNLKIIVKKMAFLIKHLKIIAKKMAFVAVTIQY